MTMLHTINKSPFERNSLDSCLGHLKEGASVLLIEDAIYGAINGNAVTGKIKAVFGKCKFYVLGPDVKARGIDEKRVIEGINIVDYSGFVDLVTNHDSVQSWL